MKRSLIVLIALALLLPAVTASATILDFGGNQPLNLQLLEADDHHVLLSVDIGSLNLKPMKNNDDERFWRLALPGAGLMPEIGDPELPVLTRMVQLPAEGEAKLTVLKVVYETVDLNNYGGYSVWPYQRPIDKVPGAKENAPFDYNESAYARSGYFGPATMLQKMIVMRGMRFVPVTISPVTYDAAANMLKVATHMVVRVDFTKSADKVGVLTDEALRATAFDALAQGMFINYGTLSTLKDPTVPEAPIPGGFLIISAPAFVDNADLLDLAAWKAEKGYQVTVVSTDDTGTSKEAIQAFIQDAYETWEIPPAYVLFVGDTNTITYWYVDEVSDIYYVCVDGEDYFNDLFYSRFSVRTAQQLANMVAKTLQYEMGDWADPDIFLKAAFMASTDNYSITEGTHNYVINTWLDDAGFTSTKRYNHAGATTQQVLNDINGGLNYLIYSGHGSEDSWADGPAVSTAQVQGLTNTYYPYVASHACLTSSYDLDECFGETWTRSATGAVMFWGASTYTQWEPDDILERRYFDCIFDDSLPRNYYTFGEFTTYGMVKLWEYYSGGSYSQEYWEKYIILGDASVDMWTGQPTALSVSHSPVIFFGATFFDVSVPGVPGALVGLSLNGEWIASALTDGSGAAHLTWSDPIAAAGAYTLTVTKHDRLPYQGDVTATASSSNGIVMASPEIVGDNMTITMMVSDADLAGNGTTTVDVTSDAEPAGETVTLNEIGSDTGAFTGTIDTHTGTAVAGKIKIQADDTVVVDYYDANTGKGSAHKTAEVEVDLTAPTFAGLSSADGFDLRVELSWSAATEPHGPVVYSIYRAETSGGQNFDTPLATTTNLAYTDNGLTNYTDYYYVVRATDALGNQETNTHEVVGTPEGPLSIWLEDWESPKAVGEWEITNLGSNNDTWTIVDECDQCGSTLFSGTYMMADSDCAGSGVVLTEALASPIIDLSEWEGVFLRFANYVNHMGEQYCRLMVSTSADEWTQVTEWNNDIEEVTTVDLSDYVDNEEYVRLRFDYHGEYDWWWAIDNVELMGYPGGGADDDTVDEDTVDDDPADDDAADDDDDDLDIDDDDDDDLDGGDDDDDDGCGC